jgi:hypothetical protein
MGLLAWDNSEYFLFEAYQSRVSAGKKGTNYQTSEKDTREIGSFRDIVFSGHFHYTEP